jgi:hypothetical protein
MMGNKSYSDLAYYRYSLIELKKVLIDLEKYEVKEIKFIKEDEYTKEKLRVKITIFNENGKDLGVTANYDIYTQYKSWNGREWLIVKLDKEDIRKDIEEVIKEVSKND